eukprot:311914-Ditylum_brightwellii.AAC.1
MCVCLEEAELQKPIKKRIACAIKEHDKLDDEKKTKPHHKKCEGQTKRYGRRILRATVLNLPRNTFSQCT